MSAFGTNTLPFAERGRIHALLARSFQGLTWKRIGVFCLIPALGNIGAVVELLWQGKGGIEAALGFLTYYSHFFLGFAPGLLAILVADNWLPGQIRGRALLLMAAFALGALLGALLMYAAGFEGFRETVGSLRVAAGLWVGVGFVGAIAAISYVFVLRTDEAHSTMHQERLDRIRIDRELTEARLQVLQAQIEPHFLFNTLANVRRLYQTDPAIGRAMLQHLSRYLSAALPGMREPVSTLDRELALTVAYLNVQQIRMEERLAFAVDVPDSLRMVAFPPMMLVTLVENAVRHGLGPLPEGGRVEISARADEGTLRVQVADTGRGLAKSSGTGVGLANIRARLHSLYTSHARLVLKQNSRGGVTATIEVPYAAGANVGAS
jgi:signal transduction histidine kinase